MRQALDAAARIQEVLPFSEDYFVAAWTVNVLANLYMTAGDPAQAIDLLDYGLSVPSAISAPLLAVDPTWDPLRDHPRFQNLLTEANQQR